jgi:probable phosphoglycerate mutase
MVRGMSPQQAGVGVVVQNPLGEVVLVANRTFSQPMTNTEAEYLGLMMALEVAQRYNQHVIEIRMDNEVVVYQMVGRFAVRSQALKPLHRKACELARRLNRVMYTHVPREQNLVANALAGEAVAGRRWCSKGI